MPPAIGVLRINAGKNGRAHLVFGGDGVLAIDANGDGKIDQRSEVVFTDWTEIAVKMV
ncbi:MAG: hypothetical protein ACRCUX_10410 [Beijerinckiaceae bacterium]